MHGTKEATSCNNFLFPSPLFGSKVQQSVCQRWQEHFNCNVNVIILDLRMTKSNKDWLVSFDSRGTFKLKMVYKFCCNFHVYMFFLKMLCICVQHVWIITRKQSCSCCDITHWVLLLILKLSAGILATVLLSLFEPEVTMSSAACFLHLFTYFLSLFVYYCHITRGLVNNKRYR